MTGLVTLLLPTLQPLCHPKVIQVWANSDFARHYFRNRGFFLFLQVLRWFTSPRWLPRAYAFSARYRDMTLGGLPHSEIPGSMPACGSPRLIAACHVLHRLLLPRHPPCALSSLTIKFTRHTAASLPASAISCQPSANPPHTAQTLWACLPAPRTGSLLHISNLLLRINPELEICNAKLLRTPAGFSLGTHKNLQPCRLPNLFSCQISSS